MDIREFLEARMAEDEQAAREVPEQCRSWSLAASATVFDGEDTWYVIDQRNGRHIARHDPARVLRDVEAGRLLLATVDAFEHLDCPDPWYSCPLSPDGCADEDVVGCSCWVEPRRKRLLRVLTLPYADHPDCDPSWLPEATS